MTLGAISARYGGGGEHGPLYQRLGGSMDKKDKVESGDWLLSGL